MKTLLFTILYGCTILSAQLFINEIDYDQLSTDTSEFLEIAGPADTYSNVTVVLINGNPTTYGEYNTFDLGTITLTDENQGYGFYVIGGSAIPNVDYTSGFPSSNAIQNGDPDGIELWVNGQLVEAVSYAGSMNDTQDNLMEEATPNDDSDDIYWEGGEGLSIGRIGVNGSPWNVGANSPGAVNQGQTLDPDADFPPTANAGADQTVSSGDTVTLDGSESTDSDGTIVEYLWELTAGSGVTLNAYDQAVVSFTVPTVTQTTTWTFLLTVEDDGGNTSSAEVNVTVYILTQIDIYEIQENFGTYDGQLVNVVGVVTIGDDLLHPDRTKFYIQDESGRGIQIFDFEELDVIYNRGDSIEVVGTVTSYETDVEIISPTITLLSTGSNLPEAHTAAGNEGSTMNGTWAKVTGVLSDYWAYQEQHTSLTITTSEDTEIQTMFWNSAVPQNELTDYENMIGDELSISGVITFYNGAVQLTCGYKDDIQTNTDATLPVADAGPDQVAQQGEIVTLDGSGSYDIFAPDSASTGGIMFSEWLQIGDLSSPVDFVDSESLITTFEVPENATDSLAFRLTVYDAEFNDDLDTVYVMIASEATIYNIQYTTDPGASENDCYPSPLVNNVVTTSGVVTHKIFADHESHAKTFFLQQTGIGEWGGIFVYDYNISPNVGDELILTGIVNEYGGGTQLTDILDHTIESSGNSTSEILVSSLADLGGYACNANAESYESMLIKVNNVTVVEVNEEFGYWIISDNSGDSAQVDDHLLDAAGEGLPDPPPGEFSITGILNSYFDYNISPRFMGDIAEEEIDPYCGDGACNGDETEADCPEDCSLANLFLSEWAEGTSNNKYFEIYNATDGNVDLSGYSVSSCSNGCDDGVSWDYPDNITFEAGTIIASDDVYVICHPSSDALIQAECDQTFTYLSNGNDVFALTQIGGGTILDIIGTVGDDPGTGWEVAGVSDGTSEHTIVRKSSVVSGNNGNWISSAGTNADDSEWEVYEQNNWNHLGSHTMEDIDECIADLGDLNDDSYWNVLDVVTLANCILGGYCDDEEELTHGCAGDINEDSNYNVLDIVNLANCILSATCDCEFLNQNCP